MLTVFVLPLILVPTSDVPLITPYEAKDHVGQEVVVRGVVAQVDTSDDGQGLFVGFGLPFPDHVFNAVILGRDLRVFPDARSWERRIIEVRGRILAPRGDDPVIVLQSQEQVTVIGQRLPDGGEMSGVLDGTLGVGDTGTSPMTDYDSPPKPIKITRPQYPQEAFAKKIEGTVLVEIMIDSSGRVVRARVLQSVPMLDAAAIRAAYEWTFQPAVKHGKRVPTIAQAPISFWIDPRERRK